MDAARRPEHEFVAAGQNRTMWIVLNAVGIFTCVLLPVVYLIAIRPKVKPFAGMPPPAPGYWPHT